ncbi:MAG: hypothetical protein C4326_06695 [Ignavibacteria bacterium]
MKSVQRISLSLFFGLMLMSQPAGAQWVHTNGPYGGLTSALGVNPNAVGGTTIFVGTLAGGNFRSTNNGATWTASSNGLSFGGIYFGATAFAAKGTSMFAGTAAGVYLTTDNGITWTATALASSIQFLIVNGNDLFAGTSSAGVYRSTNNGTSWTQLNSGLTATRVNALVVSGTSMFAGTETAGTFVTTNGETSWSPSNAGIAILAVKALAVNGTTLFAGSLSGIYRSTNGGANWSSVSTHITNALLVNGTSIYAAGSGVVASSDNGNSWTPVNTGLTSSLLLLLSLAANGPTLFAGGASYRAGVYVSSNGGALWSESHNGILATHIRSFKARLNGSGGHDLFAGGERERRVSLHK